MKPTPQSARKVLHKLVEMARKGFSGEVTLVFHQGGVRKLTVSEQVSVDKLPDAS